jgi:hypothetical protein
MVVEWNYAEVGNVLIKAIGKHGKGEQICNDPFDFLR